MGGVRGAFLKCENEYMGRFCNTTQPAVFSSLCSPSPTCSPCPALCFLPSFTKFLFYFCFSHPYPILLPPHSPVHSFPVPSALFPGSLFISVSVPLAACPGPLSYVLVWGPWELEFTAKQEEPVSKKMGVGQGVNSQQ